MLVLPRGQRGAGAYNAPVLESLGKDKRAAIVTSPTKRRTERDDPDTKADSAPLKGRDRMATLPDSGLPNSGPGVEGDIDLDEPGADTIPAPPWHLEEPKQK